MQNTFGEFLRNTPPITMKYGLTFPSGRMRLARAQSSGSETLSPIRSSAGYTIDMHESDFSEATHVQVRNVRHDRRIDPVQSLGRDAVQRLDPEFESGTRESAEEEYDCINEKDQR